VALTPEALLAAGVSGAAAGGVPGAIAAVASTAILNFTGSQGRIPTFAGTPKGPLEIPFREKIAPFLQALGREAAASSGRTISSTNLSVIQREERRFGFIIASQIFNNATVAQLREFIGFTPAPLVASPTLTEVPGMVMNPVTGVEQEPERVDRGRYNEGLGNEFVSQPQAKALAPMIVPTIELTEMVVHERVVGGAVQRRNSLFVVAPEATILTIPAKDGFHVWIKSAQVNLSPFGAVLAAWHIQAYAVTPGTTAQLINHFRSERNNTALAFGDVILEQVYPSFDVTQGRDYIVRFEVINGIVQLKLNIDAYYVPIGVNGRQ